MNDAEMDRILKLLDGRFDGVGDRLDDIATTQGRQATTLEHLTERVGKQNGRVDKLEEQVAGWFTGRREKAQASREERSIRWQAAGVLIALFGIAATVVVTLAVTGQFA